MTPFFRGVALLASLSLVAPGPAFAQSGATAAATQASRYNMEQLDALLAPVALYPDALLMQLLMASTYPAHLAEAARWLEQPGNRELKGDALAKALERQNWDPSVKSLVPFPQVIAMLTGKPDWMRQLGYAFSVQQAEVMNSVQRLRRQAQAAGNLKNSEQQRVIVERETIIIEPASPQVVYVPVYNPTVVYGTWPYAAYPPVYIPPPPGYVVGTAVVAGIAFAAGVVIVGSLWGWCRPAWRGGYVHVDVNRVNVINVNRTQINTNVWRAPGAGPGGPPGGPVGAPGRPSQMPANAIGRPSVQVPRDLVTTDARPGPAPSPRATTTGVQRNEEVFGGLSDGGRAGQYSNRGAQSRSLQQRGARGRAAAGGR